MSPNEVQLTDQIWESLKIAIIAIAALAPVIIVFLIIRFNRIKKQLINEYQTNQSLVKKRMEIYDRIGPKLNDILCFLSYTGNWKELTPLDIMRLKRDLDKEMNITTPLFSEDLLKKYNSFMHLCFVSHSGWEHEEKIKSQYVLRQEQDPNWLEEYIPYFDTNNVVEGIKVKERYDELMAGFKRDISL